MMAIGKSAKFSAYRTTELSAAESSLEARAQAPPTIR